MAELQLAHPDLEQLRAFSLGRLDDEAASTSISAHLNACANCCRTLESIAGDTLESLVRCADTASLDPTPGLAPPPALLNHPRYHIEEGLGAGGMGTVYKARHKLMDRIVALKVIHPRLVEKPGAVARFRQEVRAAAQLSHPNIVTAHDAEQAGDQHLLVMEFVAGQSLADVVRASGPLPAATACAYVRQAALGLQHAHERGMVHRDIKPHNLMLTPDGQVKVLDFGLARMVRELEPATALTADGVVMGTPDYMAPEQAEDARQADIRADIYSLGCTLYFLLTGQPPFPTGTFLQKIFAHRTETPRPLSELRSEAPPELIRVLERLLAKDRDQRYQTPGEVAAALEPFVKEKAAPTKQAALSTVPAPRNRRLLPLVAIAAALVVGVGLLAQQIIIRYKDEKGQDQSLTLPKGSTDVRVENPAVALNINPDPLPPIKGGDPLSSVCFVNKPAEIKGVQSWTIETVGHRFDVSQVSYSPDGKWFVSADDTGMLRCWDPADGYALEQILVGPADVIHALAWGPDKKTLAVARHTGAVDLWDVAAGRKLRTLKADAPVMSVSWTPDGQSLAAGCQGDAKGEPTLVWNPASGEVRHKKLLGAQVAYSPDGQTLAACDSKGKVRFFKAATLEHRCDAQQKWSGHLGARPLVWPPKQNMVVFGDWRPTKDQLSPYFILGFEAAMGNLAIEVSSDGVAAQIRYALSADGKVLFHTFQTGDEHSAGCVQLDLQNKKLLGRTDGALGSGRCVACSPDGLMIAVGKGSCNSFGNGIALIELASGKVRRELPPGAHRCALNALTWSGDAKHLCVAFGGTWEAETGRVHSTVAPSGGPLNEPFSVSVAPDGMARLVYGHMQARIEARENTNGPFKTMVPQLEAGLFDLPCSWSRDSRTLVHSGKNKLVFREARTGKVIREHTLQDLITALDLSPDGKTVIAKTGAFLEWVKADTGEVIDRLQYNDVLQVAYSPDGKKLALGFDDGYVEVRSEDAQKTLLRFKAAGHLHERREWTGVQTSTARGLTWSPDGRMLGTASGTFHPGGVTFTDACVRLWDVATGQPRATLVPLVDQKGLALTADGHYRGTPDRIERDIRYVAQLADRSQVTLTPAEFEKRFGWKNEPEKVRLVGK